ncbi:MAG: HAMP domain-containing histidine kinase [Proteobacteria bacterium]|nr:HAMP domain-containing histidine kinase [Pseudomonadota bacterium]
MDRDDIYKKLKKEFEATFIDELIPGILHNFANPLNGIMGRSKLLQRRLGESIKKINERFPEIDSEIMEDHKKLIDDVDLITDETDRFLNMFQVVAEKFYIISNTSMQRINLSDLIETEMRFSEFYLDLKHHVKKTVNLDSELPEITGVPAYYSICLSTFIRHSMDAMKNSPIKEFLISTSCDDRSVCVKIQDTGASISEDERKSLLKDPPVPENACSDLFYALLLLKKYDVRFQVYREAGMNALSIEAPY